VRRPDDPVGQVTRQGGAPGPEDAEPDRHLDGPGEGDPFGVQHPGGFSLQDHGLSGQESPNGADVVGEGADPHWPLADREAGGEARTEARPEAAARDPGDRRDPRDHGHLRPLVRDQNGGPEADPRGPLGGQRQVDERVLPERRRIEDPGPGVAELLGQLDQGGEVGARGEPTGQLEVSHAAGPFPSTPRRSAQSPTVTETVLPGHEKQA
jgi:hypothetical protein